jgi:hypothetical protein
VNGDSGVDKGGNDEIYVARPKVSENRHILYTDRVERNVSVFSGLGFKHYIDWCAAKNS